MLQQKARAIFYQVMSFPYNNYKLVIKIYSVKAFSNHKREKKNLKNTERVHLKVK